MLTETSEFGNQSYRDPAATIATLLQEAAAAETYPNPFIRLDFATVAHARATTGADWLSAAEAARLASCLSRQAGLEESVSEDWDTKAAIADQCASNTERAPAETAAKPKRPGRESGKLGHVVAGAELVL